MQNERKGLFLIKRGIALDGKAVERLRKGSLGMGRDFYSPFDGCCLNLGGNGQGQG